MSTLMIAYELAEPGTNGRAIAHHIMRLGVRWARPLASLWFVETDDPSSDIETELQALLSEGDALVVSATDAHAAVVNTTMRWTSSYADAEPASAGRGDPGTRWAHPLTRIATAA